MPGATIGHDVETGKPVVIEDDERQRGLYIIGTTGTGKTTLLESLALQDIRNGLGVCVLLDCLRSPSISPENEEPFPQKKLVWFANEREIIRESIMQAANRRAH
jgi:hypothetical protein